MTLIKTEHEPCGVEINHDELALCSTSSIYHRVEHLARDGVHYLASRDRNSAIAFRQMLSALVQSIQQIQCCEDGEQVWLEVLVVD